MLRPPLLPTDLLRLPLPLLPLVLWILALTLFAPLGLLTLPLLAPDLLTLLLPLLPPVLRILPLPLLVLAPLGLLTPEPPPLVPPGLLTPPPVLPPPLLRPGLLTAPFPLFPDLPRTLSFPPVSLTLPDRILPRSPPPACSPPRVIWLKVPLLPPLLVLPRLLEGVSFLSLGCAGRPVFPGRVSLVRNSRAGLLLPDSVRTLGTFPPSRRRVSLPRPLPSTLFGRVALSCTLPRSRRASVLDTRLRCCSLWTTLTSRHSRPPFPSRLT